MNNEKTHKDLWIEFAGLQREKVPKGGILVVGHGTRNAAGVQELIDLVGSMRDRLPESVPIEASFLELANPTIDHAVEKLQALGCEKLLVIPILLFSAAHAREDIPDAVRSAVESRSIEVAAQSTSLGTEEAALKLSQERFMAALKCRNREGCLRASACDIATQCMGGFLPAGQSVKPVVGCLENQQDSRVGLAMVGRGTSDLVARGHMLELTRLRVEASPLPISWVETGFFAGGSPTVEELLKEAEASDSDCIVVQPHLLFEGQLSVQLRAMVDTYRLAGSKKRWLVAPTLGADPQLADTFLALGLKAILSISSNGS
ncbi:MAG: sirohydrochlorin chelatase [Planctomycetota bacterium]|nr:sirohydrochlorin chelatase [Planctomycetota bacterium]